MAKFVMIVRTFEPQGLVVEHRFFGETLSEAKAVFRAHLKTGAFLKASTLGNFEGIPLRNETSFGRI